MIRIPTTSRRASAWLVAVALAGLLCSYKSDDDGGEDNVIGPESRNVTSLDDAVLAERSAAIEQAIGLLFVGGDTVAGGGGGQTSSKAISFASRSTPRMVSSSWTAS